MPPAPLLTAILCCGTKKHLALSSPCLSQDLASHLTQVYTHTQYTYIHIPHTQKIHAHLYIHSTHTCIHMYTHIKNHTLIHLHIHNTNICICFHTHTYSYTHSHLFKWLSLLPRRRHTSSDSNLPIPHLPLMGSWGCRGLDQCIHMTLRCY